MSVYKVISCVILASKARRESFCKAKGKIPDMSAVSLAQAGKPE